VGLMVWRTAIRNTDWADNIPLAISTARDNPNSGKACSWAGAVLMLSNNPEHVAFGKSLVERAIELSPDYVSARWELAKYYGVHGQLGESAIRVAQAARADPGTAITRTAVPALIQDLKKADVSTYLPVIEGYFREHPDEDAASLAMAFAYHAQGKLDEAEKHARRALDLALQQHSDRRNQFHEAGAEMAAILFERGVRDGNRELIVKALDEFRLYLSYIPQSVEGHLMMATMLLSLDTKQFPGMIKEAQANIDMANTIEARNSHVRAVQGQLNEMVRALAKSTSTASVMPDSKTDPVPPAGVGP
jgi:tetratricopeptide (TPR) repeat protein